MKHALRKWKGSFGHRLGMMYEKMEPGYVKASLEIRPEHCNPNHVCHGGAIFTFADDSMGGALHPLSPEGHVPTSTQLNIHFARSVRAGQVVHAEARVVAHGKRTAVVEARVTDEEGSLIALVTASYLFVEARYVDPGSN